MKYEQVINMWRQGFSKKYIIDLHYHDLKSTGIYKRESAKQLRQIAYKEIEDMLLAEYRTRYTS